MASLELNKVELPEQVREFIERNIPRYPTPRAVLVPALMECQKHYGHVSPEMVLQVAEQVGVPYAEAQSVLSFYTMLLTKPVGKYVIGVCGTWNCAHAGSGELVKHFKDKYSCDIGDIAADGLFTMLQVECMADCHNAPSVQFLKPGRKFKAWWANNLTVELFDAILKDLAASKDDALRERLVRIDHKANPPDDKQWIWLVTTNNQYPAWVEQKDGEYIVHDAFGKLTGMKENNPQLFAEIQEAMKEI